MYHLKRFHWLLKLKPALILLLLVCAIGYVISILVVNPDELQRAISSVSPLNIFFALMISVPMYLLKAGYHFYTLQRITQNKIHFSIVAPAYLQAQVVRYLPGKIWGIVYQVQRTSASTDALHVVTANLFQMITTNLCAIGLVVPLLLASIYQNYFYCLSIIFTIYFVEWNHRTAYVEKIIIGIVSALASSINIKDFGGVVSMPWKGTVLLLSEWAFYCGVFFFLLEGHYSYEEIASIVIYYAAASLISLAFIFIPAGIVVREGIFVSFAGILYANELDMLIIASLLRLIWISSELITAFIATIALTKRLRSL